MSDCCLESKVQVLKPPSPTGDKFGFLHLESLNRRHLPGLCAVKQVTSSGMEPSHALFTPHLHKTQWGEQCQKCVRLSCVYLVYSV